MKAISSFFNFWKNFLIGDDWVAAIIVLVGFGVTYFVAQTSFPAFWIMPAVTLIALAYHFIRQVNDNK